MGTIELMRLKEKVITKEIEKINEEIKNEE